MILDYPIDAAARERAREEERLLELAFAPLHKRAFGMAVALASALTVFLGTVIYLMRQPEHGFQLQLLAEYFFGYTVTWRGALVGAGWGAIAGFVAGWFAAFCRNLVMAISLIALRARVDLGATADFLDHI